MVAGKRAFVVGSEVVRGSERVLRGSGDVDCKVGRETGRMSEFVDINRIEFSME